MHSFLGRVPRRRHFSWRLTLCATKLRMSTPITGPLLPYLADHDRIRRRKPMDISRRTLIKTAGALGLTALTADLLGCNTKTEQSASAEAARSKASTASIGTSNVVLHGVFG